ncbi:MAG: DUF2865 domain-containing protein [Xanthobacteraceae bacterium]|nr:DUF2865 domain-containing protein [Xanthobacteraceae bacterium]
MFKLNPRGGAPRRFGVSVAFLVVIATLTHAVPAKAGLLEAFFGSLFGAPQATAPHTGGYASYCVRTCDGRYFPLTRSAPAQAGQICQGLCPAAETKVFSGSDINYATATDGTPYNRLANAFLYRQKIVPGCTCNGRDTFGTAAMKLEDDPTLRPDDLIATKNGLVRYTGAPGTQQFAAADNAAAPPPPPPVRRRASTQATPVFPFFFPIVR